MFGLSLKLYKAIIRDLLLNLKLVNVYSAAECISTKVGSNLYSYIIITYTIRIKAIDSCVINILQTLNKFHNCGSKYNHTYYK